MMEKEELKEISKLFIDYDGDVQVNPFAKVHWGMIKDSLKDNNLYIDDNKNFGKILSEAKSNRAIRDFSRSVVGNIKKGDWIVKFSFVILCFFIDLVIRFFIDFVNWYSECVLFRRISLINKGLPYSVSFNIHLLLKSPNNSNTSELPS